MADLQPTVEKNRDDLLTVSDHLHPLIEQDAPDSSAHQGPEETYSPTVVGNGKNIKFMVPKVAIYK